MLVSQDILASITSPSRGMTSLVDMLRKDRKMKIESKQLSFQSEDGAAIFTGFIDTVFRICGYNNIVAYQSFMAFDMDLASLEHHATRTFYVVTINERR